MIVTLAGVRSKLVELIPRSVMLATSAGIGLFLAHIGMQASGAGRGLVGQGSAGVQHRRRSGDATAVSRGAAAARTSRNPVPSSPYPTPPRSSTP